MKSTTTAPRIFLSAGESSGDQLSAHIMCALQKHLPQATFCGVAGPAMASAGIETWADQRTFAHMGLGDILRHGRGIWRAYRHIGHRLREESIDLAILTDCPELNMRLAKICHQQGIPVLYFIPPKWWAWRQRRLAVLSRYVDAVASVLPFERAQYAAKAKIYPIDYHFVGHPMAWQSPPIEHRHPIDFTKPWTLGLLPGSREGEIKRHLPFMLEAAAQWQSRYPHVRIQVSLANELAITMMAAWQRNHPHLAVDIEQGSAQQTLQSSDLLWCASGTVTLEAALAGLPMVVVYRMDALSSWLAKRLVKTSYVSLPNLIFDQAVVPELLLTEATVDHLIATTEAWVKNPQSYASCLQQLKQTKTHLCGQESPGDAVARLAIALLAL